MEAPLPEPGTEPRLAEALTFVLRQYDIAPRWNRLVEAENPPDYPDPPHPMLGTISGRLTGGLSPHAMNPCGETSLGVSGPSNLSVIADARAFLADMRTREGIERFARTVGLDVAVASDPLVGILHDEVTVDVRPRVPARPPNAPPPLPPDTADGGPL